MGKYDKYWEMRQGGPHDEGTQIFKCTECGGESEPDKGWNGRPDKHNCKPGCSCRESDWEPGRVRPSYRENLGKIIKGCGCPMGSRCGHPSSLET